MSRLNGALVAFVKALPGAGRYCKRKPSTGTLGLVPMDGVESKARSLMTFGFQRPPLRPSQASLGKPPWRPSHTSHRIVPSATSF